jgi:hypothetical protein
VNEKKDVVIRISRDNHKRLKALLGGGTINELMEKLLDSMESVSDGELIYVVGNQTFKDIAEARGEAIVRAVKDKSIPMWPKVAVVVGSDEG